MNGNARASGLYHSTYAPPHRCSPPARYQAYGFSDMAENGAMRELAASLGFNRGIEAGYPAEAIHTLEL